MRHAQPRFLLVPALLTAALLSSHAEAEDSWQVLKVIRRDKDYTILTRSGECVTGRIDGLDDGILKLRPRSSDAVGQGPATNAVPVNAFKRTDVLRVTDNHFGDAHDTIFSGRSSWSDVVEARPIQNAEWLKVVTKAGKAQTCKPAEVLEDRIRCGADVLLKTDLGQVYYVRLKPASEWMEYAAKEGVGWLDARTWFNYLLLGRIDVLLFDRERPEENQHVACKQ